MIRLLQISDFPEAFSISQLKSIRGRENETITEESVAKLFETDNTFVLGYFDESSELVTWVAYRFGTIDNEKIWCIVHMFTKDFTSYFTFNRPDIGPMIAKIFTIAEEQEYYTYIYAIPKKLENIYYRQWKSNKYLPPTGRYETSDLAFVEANTVPDQNWLRRLSGAPQSYDMVIKKRTLKNEYRINHSFDPA